MFNIFLAIFFSTLACWLRNFAAIQALAARRSG